MKKIVKKTVVIINLIILIFAALWSYNSNFQYEPIIVFLGQFCSIIVLLFGEKIYSKINVSKVKESKVSIELPKEDKGEYSVNDIKGNSKVKIKKS